MAQQFLIRKASGEREPFDVTKFKRSLERAGADKKTIDHIVREVERNRPKSTREVHELATYLLKKQALPVADRYNIKRALVELGPHGYSFEQFIGQLFRAMKYEVETNRIVAGACVDHEIDVLAKKKDIHYMIEVKFHNKAGMKSDVKIPLYVQARFEDILDANKQSKYEKNIEHKPYIVTNTKFTTQAIQYAACKGIELLGWAYPEKLSLVQLIQKYRLFPITTLTSLSRHQKRHFIQSGFVLCKDAQNQAKVLKSLGLKDYQIQKIIEEANAVCNI